MSFLLVIVGTGDSFCDQLWKLDRATLLHLEACSAAYRTFAAGSFHTQPHANQDIVPKTIFVF